MTDFASWEDRPRHPVTGAPADYLHERATRDATGKAITVREPRWRDPFLKSADPAECWYSVEEVSQRVGKDVQWVRRMCREGRLAASKPRGCRDWFIRGDRLIAFIENQTEVAPCPSR